MPVIPSFGRYAEAPDLAGAYLGARRADIAAFEAATQYELGQRRIAQEAAESEARINLGYQTLEAKRVENEMELAARKETQERENLRKQQEAQILKSYRDTQIGMAERRLKIAEATEKQRIQEVAADFGRQQEYQRLQAMGLPADEIVRRIGPEMTGFATALGEMTHPTTKAQTASDRSLQYRFLTDQEKSILNKYPSRINPRLTPDDQAALKDIREKKAQLFEQSSQPQWMVPPETIPYGNPNPVSAPMMPSGMTPTTTSATNVVQTVTPPSPKQVTTQAEFDALKPGEEYTGKNGKRYRKPL